MGAIGFKWPFRWAPLNKKKNGGTKKNGVNLCPPLSQKKKKKAAYFMTLCTLNHWPHQHANHKGCVYYIL